VNKNILVVAVVSILVIGGVFASNYLKTEETPDQINGDDNETTTIPDEDTPEPSETDTEDAPEQSNEAEPEDEPEPTTENETPPFTLPINSDLHSIPEDERLLEDINIPDGADYRVYSYNDFDILGWYREELADYTLADEGTQEDDYKAMQFNWIKYQIQDKGYILFTIEDPEMPSDLLGIIQDTWNKVSDYTPRLKFMDEMEEKEGAPSLGNVEYMFPQNLPLPDDPILFNRPPVNVEDIEEIWPFGNLGPGDGHTFPTQNGYILWKNPESYPPDTKVYSPADGYIIELSYHKLEWPQGSGRTGTYNDYEIRIATAKTQITRLGHVSELSEELIDKIGEVSEGMTHLDIEVSEGELLGYTGGRPQAQYTMNWRVHDLSISSYINPMKYGLSSTEGHFLEYCTPELYEQLVPLMTRTEEPITGVYDYDINGTLSGNWFHENIDSEEPMGDWDKHLSFCYDMYDSKKALISIGGMLDVPIGVYLLEEETPKFSQVKPDSGAIYYWAEGDPESDEHSHMPRITVLVELLDYETLRIEAFSGWINEPSFSENAQIYTR